MLADLPSLRNENDTCILRKEGNKDITIQVKAKDLTE